MPDPVSCIETVHCTALRPCQRTASDESGQHLVDTRQPGDATALWAEKLGGSITPASLTEACMASHKLCFSRSLKLVTLKMGTVALPVVPHNHATFCGEGIQNMPL
jgi:hypothetical protein